MEKNTKKNLLKRIVMAGLVCGNILAYNDKVWAEDPKHVTIRLYYNNGSSACGAYINEDGDTTQISLGADKTLAVGSTNSYVRGITAGDWTTDSTSWNYVIDEIITINNVGKSPTSEFGQMCSTYQTGVDGAIFANNVTISNVSVGSIKLDTRNQTYGIREAYGDSSCLTNVSAGDITVKAASGTGTGAGIYFEGKGNSTVAVQTIDVINTGYSGNAYGIYQNSMSGTDTVTFSGDASIKADGVIPMGISVNNGSTLVVNGLKEITTTGTQRRGIMVGKGTLNITGTDSVVLNGGGLYLADYNVNNPSTVNFTGGTFDLQNVDTVPAVKMGITAKGTNFDSDKIVAKDIKGKADGSQTFNIATDLVVTTTTNYNGGTTTIQLFEVDTLTNFSITGSKEVTWGSKKYVIKPSTTIGAIVVKLSSPSLRMVVQGKGDSYSNAITMDSDLDLSSWTDEETEYNTNNPSNPLDSSIGTLARKSGTSSRTLAITATGYTITSDGSSTQAGLVINSGDSVTVTGGTWKGFDTPFTNSGTLSISGATFTNSVTADIVNDSTLNLTGATTFSKGIIGSGTTNVNANIDMGSNPITQGKVVVNSSGTLTMSENLTAPVELSGTLTIPAEKLLGNVAIKSGSASVNLGAGTLGNYTISAASANYGCVYIKDDVKANANSFLATKSYGINITTGKTLTLTGGTLTPPSGSVNYNQITGGSVVIGDGSSTQTVSLRVNQIANTTVSVAAKGVLELTNGALAKAIDNDEDGTVILNGASLNGAHVTKGTLKFTNDTTINANYVAATTNVVSSGTLTLTSGTLSKPVSGEGNIAIGDGGAYAQTVSSAATQFNNSGTLTVKTKGTLILTGGSLSKVISGAGNITIGNGSDVQAVSTAVSNLTNTGTISVATNGTLILTDGSLSKVISGTGNVTIGNGSDEQVVSTAASNLTNTGTISVATNGTLTLTGGSLSKVISGNGDIIIGNGTDEQTVSTAISNLANAGDLSVATKGTLNLTAGTVGSAITNGGTIKFSGAGLDGAYITTGTLDFAQDIAVNADYVAAVTNIVSSGTLTLTGGTLVKELTGAGNIAIGNGSSSQSVSSAASYLNNSGTVQVKANGTLILTGGSLNKVISGAGNITIGNGSDVQAVSTAVSNLTNTGTISVATKGDLELTGTGTLSNAVTNGGVVTLNPGTGNTLTVSGNISEGTLNISGLVVYSGSSAIGAATVIKSGGKLDPAPEKLNASTTVESGGELYLDGGTLSVDIAGSGTTYLLSSPTSGSASTVTVNSTRSIAGTLKGSGGTVNMVGGTGDNLYTTLSVGDLAGTTNLKIDLDMSGTTQSDMMTIGSVGTSGTILNLSDINIKVDYAPVSGGEIIVPVEVGNGITYVTQSGGYNSSNLTYKLNGDIGSMTKNSVATNLFVYTFTLGDAGKLNYKVAAASSNHIFKNFIEGALPNVPQTLSLTDDLADEAAGMQNNTTFDELTINVNDGKKLGMTANAYQGTIAGGDTLNLNGGSTTAGIVNTKWYVADNGKLNLSGKLTLNGIISSRATGGITVAGEVTVNGAISDPSGTAKSGSLIINGGTLIANAAITQGSGITLTGSSDKLIISVSNLQSNVTNAGTVELVGTMASTLSKTINGGNIIIAGPVTASAANLAGTTIINNGKILTLTGGALGGSIGIESTGDKNGALTVTTGAVTNAAGNNINVKTLTVSSGSLSTALNKLTVADENISNDGTLILTGKDASAASVLVNNVNNGSGTGTVQIGDGSTVTDISTAKNIANKLDVKMNAKFTTTGTVGGTVSNAGTLNISADNITSSAAITNTGMLELTGGALGNEITGNGTTVITSGSTVKMDGTYDLKNNQSLTVNGTLDMTDGDTESYKVLSVAKDFVAGTDSRINFGVNLSGVNTGASTTLADGKFDQIDVTGTASGTLTIGSVSWVYDVAGTDTFNVNEKVSFQLVKATTYDNFTIAGAVVGTNDIYKYTLMQKAGANGYVEIVKEYGFTLAEIVRGKGKDNKGSQVTVWAMMSDTDLAATDADQYKYKDGSSEKSGTDLGTLVARTGSVTTAVLTISGNGKKLKGGVTTAGATRNGITVDSSGTLNIENLAEVSDFTDYFVTNKGTLNFEGDISTTPATAVTTILKSAIKGDGTMNLSDKVTVDASATSITQKKVTLVAETKLIADADNLTVTDGITNGGTVELTDGTLASGSTDAYNKISGGSISVAGDVIANASKLAGAITINDGKTLTLNGGAISGNIGVNTTSPSIGTGALKIVTGDVTNTANKTINAKILTIASGSLSTEVDTLIVTGGSITNNGTLTLTGDGTTDTLDENIGVTDGNTISVINFEGNIKVASNKSIKAGSVINVAADKTLTVDTVGILSNITNKDGDTYGAVKLENTTASSAFLAKKITNGAVVVNGDVTTDAGNLATTKGITISSDKTLTLTGGKISDTIDGGTTGKMTITTGAVTHADGKIITVKTLTVTSGSLTVDPDDLVITTGIVNNANGGLVFNADGELGATEGITGTGTTVINGGTLTAGAAIVQDVTLTKSTDKLIIAANNLQGDVTNAGTVELAAGTGAQTMTKTINGGNIIIAGETTSDLAKLGGAITNNSTLNASGILNKNISGTSGITKINGTLTANNNTARTIEGTLNLNSKTLDMQGNSLNTLNVGTLTGTGNIKFDAALDGTTASADRIIANTSTGTLNLESVNVTGSTTLSVGGSITDIDFATSGTTVSGAAYTGTSDGYLYKFEKDATNDYNLQVTKLYGYNLAQMIQNNCEAGDTVNPNVLSTFSMAANTDLSAKNVTVRTAAGTAYGSQVSHYAVWNNTGTPSLSDGTGLGTLAARSTATDPFTINGNSHTLNGGSKDGITVSSALVLNLTNISSIDNFSNCFVDNSAGTVNISAAAITGAEVGTVSGTMILNSKLMGAGAYNLLDGTLKVDDTANLAMTGTYGLNNSGILKLGSGNLKTKITGTGTTEILGTIDAESNSIAQSAMTIESGAELAVNTNNLNISSSSGAGTVINNGHLILNAAGTLEENVSGIGYITVIGDVVANGIIDNKTNTGTNDKGVVVTSGKLKINASNLQTVTENNAAVELSGGTLASGNTIKGGAISVIGTTEASADDLASDSSITNTSNLILNGGTLQDNITGAGTTTIKAGSVVKMDGSKSLSSGQNLTINGVLDMKEAVGTTENYKALNVAGALTAGGNSKINFGVKLDSGLTTGGNLSTTDYDRIVVGGVASGTLNLGSISVSANDSLTAGDTVYFQLVSSTANNITVDGTVSTTIGLFNYVFSDASAEKSAGWVKVVKGLGFTLAEIVRGKGNGNKGAEITSWSIDGDKNLSAAGSNQFIYEDGGTSTTGDDLGTLVARTGTSTAVELTINGNGHNLSAGDATKNGITVPENGTLNVEYMGTVSGFKDYFVKNDGVLNFKGNTSVSPIAAATTTLQSAIIGSGTMSLGSKVTVDATATSITQDKLTLAVNTVLKINADKLSVANGVENSGKVELGAGILANGTTITGGKISIIGNVEANADNLASASGITNNTVNQTLTLNAGTLKDSITGAGTTVIKAGASVKMDGSKSLTGGQSLIVNGTLDMTQASGTTEGYGTLSVNGSLTGGVNSKINFGVELDNGVTAGSNLGSDAFDGIIVNGTASGTLNLGSVNLAVDDTLNVGETVYIQLVTANINNITLAGTVSNVIGNYNYTFSDASTVVGKGAGWIKVVKDYGFTLAEIVRGKGNENKGATVTSWGMNSDTNLDATDSNQYKYKDNGTEKSETDIGTLVARTGTSTAVELTINGNGFNLSGGSETKNGITVPVGGTVNVENMGTVSGFKDYFIRNLGTLNFKGDTSTTPATAVTTTLQSAITGIGTMNLTDNVTVDATATSITQDKVTLATDTVLKINADKLSVANGVENSGKVELGAGTLGTGNTITGGEIVITGNVEANADDLASASGITNNTANQTLTLNGGTLKDNIIGGGTTVIKAGASVKMGGSKGLTGGQSLTLSGTLDMLQPAGTTETYDEFSVAGNLTAGANSKINFGANLAGVSKNTDVAATAHDRVAVTGTASGTLNLGSVSVLAGDNMNVKEEAYIQLVTAGTNNITIAGAASSVIGNYMYTFSDASTVAGKSAGWIKVVKDYGFTLAEIVRGKGSENKGATVTNWSLSKDTDLDDADANQYKYKDNGTEKSETDIGTLVARTGTSTAVELTINGNGYNLSGGSETKNGITVPVGGTVNVENMGTVSGFKEYFIRNLGTLNFKGDTSTTPAKAVTTTLESAITGDGTMNLRDSVIVDATSVKANITQSKIDIAAGTKLILNADNLSVSGGIANSGTVELASGSLGAGESLTYNCITGGNTIVTGTVDSLAENLVGTNVIAVSGGVLTLTVGDKSAKYDGSLATEGTGIINLNLNYGTDDDYSAVKKLDVSKGGSIKIIGGVATESLADKITQDAEGQNTVVIEKGATYKAGSTNVFNIDASGKATGFKESKINLGSGTLALTDKNCDIAFLQSVNTVLSTSPAQKDATVKVEGNVTSSEPVTTKVASGFEQRIELPTVDIIGTAVNTLVGTAVKDTLKVDGVDYSDNQAYGFSVKKLDLTAGSTGLAITNDKKVVLGGKGDSTAANLITVAGEAKAVNIVVGTTEKVADTNYTKGTLGIGIPGSVSEAGYKLNGNITVNKESKVEVNGNTEISGNVNLTNKAQFTAAENVKVVMSGLDLDDSSMSVGEGAVVETNTLTAGSTQENGLESSITGKVEVKDRFVIDKSSKEGSEAKAIAILIGDETGRGVVVAKKIELGGNIIFVDPAWVQGVGVQGASHVATETTALDGTYVAGQNAILSFGTMDEQKAVTEFDYTGLTWSESNVTAMAYIAQPVDVSNGALIVDGSMTEKPDTVSASGTVTFAGQSLLMVNGTNCHNEAAIHGISSLTVADSSKLYIANGINGGKYNILAGADVDGWDESNIITTAKLQAEVDKTGGIYTVTLRESDYHFEDTKIPAVVEAMYSSKGTAASSYMQKALEYGALNHQGMVDSFNALGNMGAIAGVNHSQFTMANIAEDSVNRHLDIQNNKVGKEIWAEAIHTKEDVDGLGGTDVNYKGQYNGTIVGADLVKNDKFTFGVALSYVKGDNNGNFSSKNETKHTGVTLYGRSMLPNDAAITYDIAFMHGTNDMRMTTPAVADTRITGDQTVNSFSVGTRFEQKVQVGKNTSIQPYVGARWLRMKNGSFTNSLGMNYDSASSNTVIVPLGLSFKAGVENGGWKMALTGDLGYQWNLGNKDITTNLSYNNGCNALEAAFADANSLYAGLGLEFAKYNFTASVGTRYVKGSSTRQNRWFANLAWQF